MKKIFAICSLMCLLAFAVTAAFATDTSPAHQNLSIEKASSQVCLQTPAVPFSVNTQITEIPVFSFIVQPVTSQNRFRTNTAQASQPFLCSNVMEKENYFKTKIYPSPGLFVRSDFFRSNILIFHSPGWLVIGNSISAEENFQSKTFSSARIIPYSRDRS